MNHRSYEEHKCEKWDLTKIDVASLPKKPKTTNQIGIPQQKVESHEKKETIQEKPKILPQQQPISKSIPKEEKKNTVKIPPKKTSPVVHLMRLKLHATV